MMTGFSIHKAILDPQRWISKPVAAAVSSAERGAHIQAIASAIRIIIITIVVILENAHKKGRKL
jgi:hypothetical protein